MSRRRRSVAQRVTVAVLAAAAAAALLSCSPDATTVHVRVSGNDSLPRIRVLRAGLVKAITADKPCLDLVNVPGMTDGGVQPAGYVFSLDLLIPVDRNLGGGQTLAFD